MLYPSSPTAVFLNRLTQDNIDALLDLPKSANLAHPLHCPVYAIHHPAGDLILKFTDHDQAQSHVVNTALFKYFHMPFPPCAAFPIKREIDKEPYFDGIENIDHRDLSHVIIMPKVRGVTFDYLLANTPPNQKIDELNYNMIRRHATAICLADHWDFKGRNIMVEAQKVTLSGKNPLLLPKTEHFSFIDPAFGLLTQESDKSDGLNTDISKPYQLISTYVTRIAQSGVATVDTLKQAMLNSCDIWQKKIEAAPPAIPYAKPKDLQDALLARTQHLRRYLA